jgi:cyclopropane-fatty-acyl-phospholipid synthase
MPAPAAVALAFVGLIVAFAAVWINQLRSQNAGMIDTVWAATLGGVAMFAAALGTGAGLNRALVALGGGIWGMRLARHLWRRNHGRAEDPRYRQFRLQWGDATARNMFWLFQLQAVIATLLSAAFFVPAYRPEMPSPFALAAALAIWFAAVAGEAAADRQLRRFLADPARRGQVCQVGWWRYSRHPNYFFECVHWFAYTALSIGMPWGWLTLAPPFLMAWLLLKVSGIPLVEAHLVHTRQGYREYMWTTNALIPWPPRTGARHPHG